MIMKFADSHVNWAKLAKLTVLFSWAPRILIFSIAMGADYSFYVKFIDTRAPNFLGYIISVLASVNTDLKICEITP